MEDLLELKRKILEIEEKYMLWRELLQSLKDNSLNRWFITRHPSLSLLSLYFIKVLTKNLVGLANLHVCLCPFLGHLNIFVYSLETLNQFQPNLAYIINRWKGRVVKIVKFMAPGSYDYIGESGVFLFISVTVCYTTIF